MSDDKFFEFCFISLKENMFKQNLILFLNAAKGKSAGKDDKPEKKTRKKRDVDAPKKPMSAFFWYQ